MCECVCVCGSWVDESRVGFDWSMMDDTLHGLKRAASVRMRGVFVKVALRLMISRLTLPTSCGCELAVMLYDNSWQGRHWWRQREIYTEDLKISTVTTWFRSGQMKERMMRSDWVNGDFQDCLGCTKPVNDKCSEEAERHYLQLDLKNINKTHEKKDLSVFL